MIITGWLFDIYPSEYGLTIWLVDREGRKYKCFHAFLPFFYMHLSSSEEQQLHTILPSLPSRITLEHHTQKEIYCNEEWPVVRVNVHNTQRFKMVVQRLERHFPHYVFFNSDIPVGQLFFYSTDLFPLAYGEYCIEQNRLVSWELRDTHDADTYEVPPFVIMELKNRQDFISTKYRKTYQLEVNYENQSYALEDSDPLSVLESLNRHLVRCDPDIILTEYGDAVLFPMLTGLATQYNMQLHLNRDSMAGYLTTRQTSYFAYGKMVHKDGAFELAGRWHLDIENSFMMGEASLDGVIEIARLTQIPVQHQSRSTIGTCLSSMQLSWAIKNDYLIPAKKREPEDFKSASTLLLADRGGLIFQPKIGYHEQVAELDFTSMYPTIMVEHNVSPETVNCRCCPSTGEQGANVAVPELNYTICSKRIGIVPSTLRTVVDKRGRYKKEKKRLKKLGDPRWEYYDHRQTSLKWMLVTCFGYLGYKNARFGRIEAHESVNAYSRDAILRAKEIAEGKGYEFIHAIIDCMWLKKDGATESDYEELAVEVGRAVGIDLSLEGIYNWILFPASKMDPHIPTANKYVGYYANREIKIRGIEVRRRDTPVFIKRIQGEILKIFEPASNVRDVELLVHQALEKAREFVDLLRSGQANPLELVVRMHISQEADQYKTRTVNAEVAKALDEAGIQLSPGESIEYIIIDASGKKQPHKAKPVALYSLDDGYDVEKYTELCLKAIETLLLPFGYDTHKLEAEFSIAKPKKPTRRNATKEKKGITIPIAF